MCLKMTQVKHLRELGNHHVTIETQKAVLLGACHKPRVLVSIVGDYGALGAEMGLYSHDT